MRLWESVGGAHVAHDCSVVVSVWMVSLLVYRELYDEMKDELEFVSGADPISGPEYSRYDKIRTSHVMIA